MAHPVDQRGTNKVLDVNAENLLVSLLSSFTPLTTGGSRYSAYFCLIRASTAASIPEVK